MGSRLTTRMTDGDPYSQQLLVVTSFLGGISFTALVLVLQQFDAYERAFSKEFSGLIPATLVGAFGEILIDLLIILIAGMCSCFVFAAWTALPAASGSPGRGNATRFSRMCYKTGTTGFLLVLPLTLLPYSIAAPIIIGIFEIVVYLFRRKATIKDDH
jgi:hypothetical protein